MQVDTSPRPTWADIDDDARTMAERLVPFGPFLGLIAVTRGGLMPALTLSHALDVRLIETVCIQGYVGRERRETRILKPPGAATGNGKGWLVVDDIADSGATIRALRQILPRATIAALYAKPEGRAWVDLFVHAVPQAAWVTFPWENSD